MQINTHTIEEKMIRIINLMPHIKINGEKLIDRFEYEDVNLWWFLRPAIYPKVLMSIQNKKTNLFKKIGSILYYDYKSIVRKFLWKLYSDTSPGGEILIISATRYWQKTIHHAQLKEIKDDIILHPLIYHLSKIYNIILIDTDYTTIGSFKTAIEKFKKNWMPIEYFYDDRINKKAEKGYKIIINRWNRLKEKKEFIKKLEYLTGTNGNTVVHNIDVIFSRAYIIPILKVIHAKKKIIDKTNPKAVLATYETGFYAKAIIHEAKKRGIKTFGIQHGVISEVHNDYIFKGNNIIPDYTFVYGKKEILTKKSSYPVNSVVVAGVPRYDIYAKIKKKDLGYILVDGNAVNERNYEVLKKFDNNIVVKLHPSQRGRFKFKFKNVLKDENIIKLLVNSSALFTSYSTLALEAIAIEKPTIIDVFSSKKYKLVPYYNEKVFFKAKSKEELEKLFSATLKKNLYVDKLKREEFLNKYLANFGKSTEFIVNFMMSKINNKYQ